MSFCKLINIVDIIIIIIFSLDDPMKFSLLFVFGPAVGIYLGLVFLVVLNFDQRNVTHNHQQHLRIPLFTPLLHTSQLTLIQN
jgi:hypothetical protein